MNDFDREISDALRSDRRSDRRSGDSTDGALRLDRALSRGRGLRSRRIGAALAGSTLAVVALIVAAVAFVPDGDGTITTATDPTVDTGPEPTRAPSTSTAPTSTVATTPLPAVPATTDATQESVPTTAGTVATTVDTVPTTIDTDVPSEPSVRSLAVGPFRLEGAASGATAPADESYVVVGTDGDERSLHLRSGDTEVASLAVAGCDPDASCVDALAFDGVAWWVALARPGTLVRYDVVAGDLDVVLGPDAEVEILDLVPDDEMASVLLLRGTPWDGGVSARAVTIELVGVQPTPTDGWRLPVITPRDEVLDEVGWRVTGALRPDGAAYAYARTEPGSTAAPGITSVDLVDLADPASTATVDLGGTPVVDRIAWTSDPDRLVITSRWEEGFAFVLDLEAGDPFGATVSAACAAYPDDSVIVGRWVVPYAEGGGSTGPVVRHPDGRIDGDGAETYPVDVYSHWPDLQCLGDGRVALVHRDYIERSAPDYFGLGDPELVIVGRDGIELTVPLDDLVVARLDPM